MRARSGAWRSLLASVCLALAALAVAAETAHAMRCSIISATDVAFGAYDSLSSTPLDTAATVSFQCSRVGVGETVMIQISRGRSRSFQPRAMTGRGRALEYNLYLDAGRTIVWGDGSSGTSAYVARPVEGRPVSVPIYARIPPRQRVPVSSYADHVMVTFQY